MEKTLDNNILNVQLLNTPLYLVTSSTKIVIKFQIFSDQEICAWTDNISRSRSQLCNGRKMLLMKLLLMVLRALLCHSFYPLYILNIDTNNKTSSGSDKM